MEKKNYIKPVTAVEVVETETLMVTATIGRTTTNQEGATGQHSDGSPLQGDDYADENDVGAKPSPFIYDPNWEN